MAQRPRGRATSIVASGLAAACIAVTAAGPAAADTIRNQEWWLSSLHVTKAWMSSKGTGVTVAVLDTGVDPTQPDLAGSVTDREGLHRLRRETGQPVLGDPRHGRGQPHRRARARPAPRRRDHRGGPGRQDPLGPGHAGEQGPAAGQRQYRGSACRCRSPGASATRSGTAPRSSSCRWTRQRCPRPWVPGEPARNGDRNRNGGGGDRH